MRIRIRVGIDRFFFQFKISRICVFAITIHHLNSTVANSYHNVHNERVFVRVFNQVGILPSMDDAANGNLPVECGTMATTKSKGDSMVFMMIKNRISLRLQFATAIGFGNTESVSLR